MMNPSPKLLIILLLLISIVIPLSSKVYTAYTSINDTEQIENKNLQYYFEPKNNINASYEAPEWISDSSYRKITNNDGLYDSTNYSIEKDKGIQRIIILGDSYTDGAFVSTVQTWPELLEKKLNINKAKICENNKNFEVINLAVASYDLQYSIERFKRKGEKYNPDLVIWFAHDEDIGQINELLVPLIEKYEKNTTLVPTKDSPYPVWEAAYDELHATYSQQDISDIQKKILTEFPRNYIESLLIVTFAHLNKDKLEVLNSLKPAVTEITDLNLNEKLAFRDKHPNILGHEVIANDIYRILSNNKTLACK